MKFRTEIEIAPLDPPIGYGSRLLSIGSCFADTLARRLAGAKFAVTANPTGVLFNPLSIAAALERFAAGRRIRREELRQGAEGWFHDDFHGSLSRPDPEAALAAMNDAVERGRRALRECDTVLVTFGTARVYERRETGRTVANCHKEPQSSFRQRLLRTEEIAGVWQPLLEGMLRGKRVLFTLSPVRHLNDGAAANSLSKAVLRVAIALLAERCANAVYFPAFELLTDDLRDYRFYADDLVHPSAQAEEYIWERFVQAAVAPGAREVLKRVEALVKSARHRPLHPGSEAHRLFAARCMEEARALEREAGVDFGEEMAVWERDSK